MRDMDLKILDEVSEILPDPESDEVSPSVDSRTITEEPVKKTRRKSK